MSGVAASIFGLIADDSQLSLPVEWAADEDAAKRLSNELLKTLPKRPGAGPPPLALLKRIAVNTNVWRGIAIASVLVWVLARFGTSSGTARWWYYPLGWVLYLIQSVYRQSRRIRVWTNHYTSYEYQDYPNLNQERQYQDNQLLVEAFTTLEVAKHYAPSSVAWPVASPGVGETKVPGGTGRVYYQPASGYCGYATINTVIGSIAHLKTGGKSTDGLGLLVYPDCLQYISARGMMRLLTRVSEHKSESGRYSAPWSGVDDLTGCSHDTFIEHVTVHINNPRYRYLCIWHRSPLFFCHDPNIRKKSVMAVHWSPLAGYLKSADRVVLIDVNASYGPFLVSPERLWTAVNLKDYIDGSYMGLIRLTVKE